MRRAGIGWSGGWGAAGGAEVCRTGRAQWVRMGPGYIIRPKGLTPAEFLDT